MEKTLFILQDEFFSQSAPGCPSTQSPSVLKYKRQIRRCVTNITDHEFMNSFADLLIKLPISIKVHPIFSAICFHLASAVPFISISLHTHDTHTFIRSLGDSSFSISGASVVEWA